jgi:hypothetical protein
MAIKCEGLQMHGFMPDGRRVAPVVRVKAKPFGRPATGLDTAACRNSRALPLHLIWAFLLTSRSLEALALPGPRGRGGSYEGHAQVLAPATHPRPACSQQPAA